MKKDVKHLKDVILINNYNCKYLINFCFQKLEDVDIQLNESQIRCNYLADDNEKLLEQLRLQREQLEAEKLTNAQVKIKDLLFNKKKHFNYFSLLNN